MAEFENEIRSERQMDGIRAAKERGVPFGRKKRLSPREHEELLERRASGVLIKTLMADYGLSKTSIYRYLAAEEQSHRKFADG